MRFLLSLRLLSWYQWQEMDTATGAFLRQMCYWKRYPSSLTHTKTHTHTHTWLTKKRNVRAQWTKTQLRDSISLPVLNLTFEPNVFWYRWQVRKEKGQMQIRYCVSAWGYKRFLMKPFLCTGKIRSKSHLNFIAININSFSGLLWDQKVLPLLQETTELYWCICKNNSSNIYMDQA